MSTRRGSGSGYHPPAAATSTSSYPPAVAAVESSVDHGGVDTDDDYDYGGMRLAGAAATVRTAGDDESSSRRRRLREDSGAGHDEIIKHAVASGAHHLHTPPTTAAATHGVVVSSSRGGWAAATAALDDGHQKMMPTQQRFLAPPTSGCIRATKAQLKVLHQMFAENPMPPGQVHATIAERIGMSRGTVRNWFQNQRAKIRRRRIENAVAMANSGGKGFPGDDLPDSEVGSNVGSNIGSDVGTIIGSSMGSIIGSNVGSIVGSYAGASAIVQSDTTVGTYLDRNGMPSAEFKPWRGDYFMSNSSTMPGRSFSDYPELAGTPATANGKRLQVLAPYQLPAPQYELRFEPYQNDSAVAGQPHNRHHFFESDIKHPLPQRPNNGRPFVMSIEALV